MLGQALRAHLDPAAHLGDPLFLAPQRLSLHDGPPVEASAQAKLTASASRLETMLAGQDLGPAALAQASTELGELASQMRAIDEGSSQPAPLPAGVNGWEVAWGFGKAALQMTAPGMVYTNVRRAYNQFPDVRESFGGGWVGTAAGLANVLPIAALAATMTDRYYQHGGGGGGLTMALNEINPLWQAYDAPLRTYEAVQSADSEAAGEQAFHAGQAIAGLLMMANGAIGPRRPPARPPTPGTRPPGTGLPGSPLPGGRLPISGSAGGGLGGRRVSRGFAAQVGRRIAPWVLRTSEALTETTAPGSLGGRMASGPSISALALPEPVMPASPLSMPPLSMPPLPVPPLPVPRPPTWMTPSGRLPAAPPTGLTPPRLVTPPGPRWLGPQSPVPSPAPLALPLLGSRLEAQPSLPVSTSTPAHVLTPSPLPESPSAAPASPAQGAWSPEAVRKTIFAKLLAKTGVRIQKKNGFVQALDLIVKDREIVVDERGTKKRTSLLREALETIYEAATNNPAAMAKMVGQLWSEALELGRANPEVKNYQLEERSGRKHELSLDLRVPREAFVAAVIERLGPSKILLLPGSDKFFDNTFAEQVLKTGRPMLDVSVIVEIPSHGVLTHALQMLVANEALAADPRFAKEFSTVGEVLQALARHPNVGAADEAWRNTFDAYLLDMTRPEILHGEVLSEVFGDLDEPFARGDLWVQMSRKLVANNPKLLDDTTKLRKQVEAAVDLHKNGPKKQPKKKQKK